MTKRSVLVVEDERDIRDLIQLHLEREGYRVLTAADGDRAFDLARTTRPDLMCLDLMLPGMDGLQLTRLLKQTEETVDIPILMVTAKGEETDIVLGLELGADDYIVKPFRPKELVARIRAVFRRMERKTAGAEEPARVEIGTIKVDTERHEVAVDGESVEFTRAEFRLLWTLIRRPGRVYTRGELVDRITDGESIILDRNVDVHVSAIRKKLGDEGNRIQTIRGVGYKFRD